MATSTSPPSEPSPPRPIGAVAADLGLAESEWLPYGPHQGQGPPERAGGAPGRPDGKLVVVSSITPTPAGDGKTTMTIGLGQALLASRCATGHRAARALHRADARAQGRRHRRRAVAGRADGRHQPALHRGLSRRSPPPTTSSPPRWTTTSITATRSASTCARCSGSARSTSTTARCGRWWSGLGGPHGRGAARERLPHHRRLEIMAVLCLAENLSDLQASAWAAWWWRSTRDGKAVPADALHVTGAMAALLKDAIHPNLVQTMEGTPALVHGGPFANIAHGVQLGGGHPAGAEARRHLPAPRRASPPTSARRSSSTSSAGWPACAPTRP